MEQLLSVDDLVWGFGISMVGFLHWTLAAYETGMCYLFFLIVQ